MTEKPVATTVYQESCQDGYREAMLTVENPIGSMKEYGACVDVSKLNDFKLLYPEH